ncbi:PIG-L family deacetylase [Streptomyces sp. NBC_00647]|uniref:PIG-L family deacetylase n=1 Tax=Streptomyces sp. NBC_00647 TaxID=2975796 RepID=UPI00386936FE
MSGTLPGLPDGVRHVLAVVAHPDDEVFGLGGLLILLADGGTLTAVHCFTHGRTSTPHGRPGDPHTAGSEHPHRRRGHPQAPTTRGRASRRRRGDARG